MEAKDCQEGLPKGGLVMRRVFIDAAELGRIGGDEFAILYDRPIMQTQAIAMGQGSVLRPTVGAHEE